MLKKALAGALALIAAPAAAETVTVAVSQIVEHPALDATREGLKRGLADAGYVDGDNLAFVFQTAQGNAATAAQIARSFVGDRPDVLVGIATPTAQALAAATQDLPIVFTAVTDPVGAKLVETLAAPGGNVTGLSDMSPVGQHLDLMRVVKPSMTTVGVVFNPGEANAQSLVDMLKAEAATRGLDVVEAPAPTSADVQTAARSVAGRSDFIYAPTDNTVASAIKAVIGAADAAGVPVFGGSTTYVPDGAVIGLGFDYDAIGYQTADYVVRILEGAAPAALPARVATGSDIVVNLAAAKALGLTIPDATLADATEIIE
ncbi:MAG: ABC transporter substrate-binding protein [Pseudomonadota bacterium]